ncbi:FAD-dependent oxidoreductase [bacterium]|nr:FAD-dependent oxidoreductase [bacterium]
MADKKTIVIVGGVAGGASCAARARRLNEDAEIILIERGANISFANCGLPYYIGGVIEDREDLLVMTSEKMFGWFNIDIRTNTEVTKINRDKKEVIAKNLSTGKEKTVSYDALVLSPGAIPIKPPIPGIESDKIHTLRNMEDTDKIKSLVDGKNAKHVVVVGGGYIGLEMVEALRDKEIKVTLVELLPQVMAVADAEFAAPLHDELKNHGVDLKLETSAAGFKDNGDKLDVELSTGGSVTCDFCILAIGVRPEVNLAKDAGLEIGKRGGIKVDDHMQTSDPDIYAVGDAIEVTDFVSNVQTLIPLAGPANRQGRIAADNILGRDSVYKKTQGTAICKVFDLAIGMTGMSERALKANNMNYEKIYVHPFSHASYYPNACPTTLKLMFDPKDGKIFGAHCVGRKGIDKRIDVIAMAIRGGLTVYDLEDVELCYAPPFGSAKDPVNFLGFAASNILRDDMHSCQVEEILANPDKFCLVDVRNRDEVEETALIPGAHNIPLTEVRSKLSELPKDKEIITYCQVGLRGYIAYRILIQKGYKVRNLIGGYRTYRDITGTSLPLAPNKKVKDASMI